MSVSLGSFLMALVTLFARLGDIIKARNEKLKNDESQILRRSKGDLEKLLVAVKIRRKIRHDNSHPGNIDSNIADGTDNAANELRKPKDHYQRK